MFHILYLSFFPWRFPDLLDGNSAGGRGGEERDAEQNMSEKGKPEFRTLVELRQNVDLPFLTASPCVTPIRFFHISPYFFLVLLLITTWRVCYCNAKHNF